MGLGRPVLRVFGASNVPGKVREEEGLGERTGKGRPRKGFEDAGHCRDWGQDGDAGYSA